MSCTKVFFCWLCCFFLAFPGYSATTGLFSTDVPLVREQQLSAIYWLNKLPKPAELLLSEAQIAERNAETYRLQPELFMLDKLPGSYSAQELNTVIGQVSAIPSTERFYADGALLNEAQWRSYRQNLGLNAVTASNPVRFALVVKRTLLTAFPSADRVFNQEQNLDLNRFQETGLFPGEAVAVLHQSTDKQWYLVRSFNYTGWVPVSDLALGSKEQVLSYGKQEPFLIVTGARVTTAYNPELQAVSELQLDMGVRLPLLSAAETGHRVHGQNPLTSHIVRLPVRQPDGSLEFTAALIPRSQDVHAGYLPFTAENIILQAFKFLGERYGWGHDYNGRDCTGFISEIYRTFGFVMPRNSGQQGNGRYGSNVRFDDNNSTADKLKVLQQARVGDLIYLPGHVAMYLGEAEGQPYIIHDVNGLSYRLPDDSFYTGTLNGVMVTPLLPLHSTADQTYLDRTYAIKSLR